MTTSDEMQSGVYVEKLVRLSDRDQYTVGAWGASAREARALVDEYAMEMGGAPPLATVVATAPVAPPAAPPPAAPPVAEGDKPKRIRRTKEQIEADRLREQGVTTPATALEAPPTTLFDAQPNDPPPPPLIAPPNIVAELTNAPPVSPQPPQVGFVPPSAPPLPAAMAPPPVFTPPPVAPPTPEEIARNAFLAAEDALLKSVGAKMPTWSASVAEGINKVIASAGAPTLDGMTLDQIATAQRNLQAYAEQVAVAMGG